MGVPGGMAIHSRCGVQVRGSAGVSCARAVELIYLPLALTVSTFGLALTHGYDRKLFDDIDQFSLIAFVQSDIKHAA